MTTIQDVAREAGVSTATVSRVINKTGQISEATAQRVQEAARRLGYEPNVMAAGLRRQQTRIILVVAPNITNPYYGAILVGISDTTRASGYSSLIYNSNGDTALEKEALEMLARRRADAAILLGTSLESDWLMDYAQQYPIFQCSEFDPDFPLPHVCVDNYKAARDATDYLVGRGHRRIGIISSTNRYHSTAQRMQGFRDALAAHGLPLPEEYCLYGSDDYSFKSGRQRACEVLSLPADIRPTALFCISDVLAQGAIAGALELGMQVPQDVSIVGFDDVEETQRYRPALTTIAQPCYDIGVTAGRLLCQTLQSGEPPERLEYLLPHKLVERKSVCDAPT